MTTILRYNKRTNTLTPVNKRTVPRKLTDAERHERKAAWNRKRNAQKRREYAVTIVPPCQRCSKSLLDCTCQPLDRHVPQYRDVVTVLNLRTMQKKVEIR